MKLFKHTTKEPICYFGTDKQVEVPETYVQKDIRALWVSNVANIDCPTTENIEVYKNKILEIIQTCKEFNINTVFFQIRTTNDAFYKSDLNPYSRFLTGKEGTPPPFDVFEWIVTEMKHANISVHAWCNPYRISYNGEKTIDEYLESCDDLNLAKQHPEYIVLDKGGKLIMNPAIQEVKDHIIASMVEIVENYDVDGIHFDDYFYPYSGLHETVNDDKEFKAQSLSLGDFRRKQVNDVIKGVYHALKKVNSNLQFGVSPFGIWKNKKEEEFGSNTAEACSESYYNQYADSLKWIKEEYIDYIVPQIYWEFGHKIAPFADICDFWVEVCKDTNVDLYVGHGAYRLGNDGEFSNQYEVTNQLKYANQFKTVKGNVFFTYKTFIDQTQSKDGMEEVKKLLNEV